MGNSYDEYVKSLNSNEKKSNEYNILKKQLMSGEKKKNRCVVKSNKKRSNSKKSSHDIMDSLIKYVSGENKYVIMGVGIVVIIAIGFLLNSVSIHHMGGHGIISVVESSVNWDGGVHNGLNEEIDFAISDMDLAMYCDESGKVYIKYGAENGDGHIRVEQIIYKNMVAAPTAILDVDVVCDGVDQVYLMDISGWEFGVPLRISVNTINGVVDSESYMVRLRSIRNEFVLKMNEQSI